MVFKWQLCYFTLSSRVIILLKTDRGHFDKSISLKKGQVSEVSAAAGGRLLSPQCHAVRAVARCGTPPVLNLGGGFIFF